MLTTFREFVNAGSFQDTGKTGLDNNFFGVGHALNMPMPTLDMPTKIIEGRIKKILYTQNPISVCLEDGTVWKATKKQWDYLRSIGREPKENLRMQLEIHLDGTIKAVNIIG